MNVVTAGAAYLDIDAYGGIVSEAELLNLQGDKAIAVSSAQPNESVTETILGWGAEIDYNYTPQSDDEFTIIDVSDSNFFDTIIDLDKVTAVIDHHPGFEDVWHDRIGDKARIEPVGAACTQVFEEWQAANLLDRMSQLSARLLLTGILDNTLNFGAEITTDRDHKAYEALIPIAGLPENWPAQYFGECQAAIEADLKGAIDHDKKAGMINLPKQVGQLVVWDAGKIVAERLDEVKKIMALGGDDWLMNMVSIGDNKSIFVAENPAVQAQLSSLVGVKFAGDVATADRMWLRKEIQKLAL